MELEAQARRDVRVGQLLERQHDVEADRYRAGVGRAAVGRLHDRRPAARASDELLAGAVGRHGRRQPGEVAGDRVVVRLGGEALGDPRRLARCRRRDQCRGVLGGRNARRAVEHEGRRDPRFGQRQLGLEQFELEAHRPQVVAQQEIGVLEREAVGRVLGLRGRRPGLRHRRLGACGGEQALTVGRNHAEAFGWGRAR